MVQAGTVASWARVRANYTPDYGESQTSAIPPLSQ